MLIFSVENYPKHLSLPSARILSDPLSRASWQEHPSTGIVKSLCSDWHVTETLGKWGEEFVNMGKKKKWLFCFAGLVAAPKTALPLWFSWTLLLEPIWVSSTRPLRSNFHVSTEAAYMEINSEFKSVFCSSTYQAGGDCPNRPAWTVASCTHSAVS